MKLKYTLGVTVFVTAMLSWYVITDKPVTFTLLSNGYCQQENAVGTCRVYMVKGFSKWHTDKHLDAIKEHALRVTRDSLGSQCPSDIIYFHDSRWTVENKDGFGSNTMEEMDSWDRNTNFIFSGMADSFLCRVYFKCSNTGNLMYGIDRNYIYGAD